jgi:hypothetical protein
MAKAADYHEQLIKFVLYHGEKGLKQRYQQDDWVLNLRDGPNDPESNIVCKGRSIPFISFIPVEEYFPK